MYHSPYLTSPHRTSPHRTAPHLISLQQQIQSTIGDGNIIGAKASIINSTIGNSCFIAATIQLDGVTIPDGTSVYMVDGKWRCKPADISIIRPTIDGYRDKLSNPEAPQSLSKNFQMHKDFAAI